jgi:hypothetical protein
VIGVNEWREVKEERAVGERWEGWAGWAVRVWRSGTCR